MTLLYWQWSMVGLLAGTLIMPAIKRYAIHHGLHDKPGQRRLHQHPIPRGGGASIVLVMLAGFIVTQPASINTVLWLSAFAVCALTGWLDDHRPMSPLMKFILLSIAAVVTIISLGPERLGDMIVPSQLSVLLHSQLAWLLTGWAITALLALLLLWLMNLFNFMDGSHGLTSSHALLVCFALILFADPIPGLNNLSWLLAGALLAFLPWNFPRPVIFLGDVGSLSLGLLSGWLLLSYVKAGALHPVQALLVPGIFLVDASATLLLRMLQGEAWYQPHTRHAYQCLIQHGWSHTRVCLSYIACQLLLVYPALWLSEQWPAQTVLIVLSCFVLLTLLWAMVQLSTSGVRRPADA